MTSYAWIGPNGFSSALQSPTVSNSVTTAMAGMYIMIVTLGNGARNIATTTVVVNDTLPTAINNTSGMSIPYQLQLEQNYPNPFNPSTTISFSLPVQSFVSLKIFDVLGREISILLAAKLPSGKYSRQWNAANMPGGIYFYQLRTDTFIKTRKLVLIK